jgi:serine/threonine-protein kinase
MTDEDTFDPWLREAARTGAAPSDPKRSSPVLGAVLSGRYELFQLLGEGGMGAVFSARDLVNDTEVAVKWLRASVGRDSVAHRRFLREARFAKSLVHPNIIRVHDLGEHDAHPYLVMDLLQGESLRDRMRSSFEPEELLATLAPAMLGVGAAHDAGIVHRDLKPENIFLCKRDGARPEPVVLDFGISTVLPDQAPLSMRLTRTGNVIGTPYYMAPEQSAGKALDQRTDIYALAVILYEALSGQLPFRRTSIAVYRVRQADEEARPIRELRPEVPERMANSIMRALSRDPNARPPNMVAFMRSLGLIESPSQITTR